MFSRNVYILRRSCGKHLYLHSNIVYVEQLRSPSSHSYLWSDKQTKARAVSNFHRTDITRIIASTFDQILSLLNTVKI